jgi:hypothetical protein
MIEKSSGPGILASILHQANGLCLDEILPSSSTGGGLRLGSLWHVYHYYLFGLVYTYVHICAYVHICGAYVPMCHRDPSLSGSSVRILDTQPEPCRGGRVHNQGAAAFISGGREIGARLPPRSERTEQ